MPGYRPLHRKAVSSGSVELLGRSADSGRVSPLSGEFAGHDIGLNEHFLPALKQRPPSLFKIFLRATHLDTFWNGFSRLRGRGPQVEERKQAVHKGLLTATVMLLAAHFVPVAGAIVLLWFNFGGYYVGGELQGGGKPEDNELKLSTLQFVAKLHELLMQASLSVIVIGLIRHELLEGRAIPFGAIFGSLQFSSASYIFSKEFAGLCRAKLISRLIQGKLVLLLLAGSILAITVGPSSAITMRPRLDTWEAGGTDIFLNTTRSALWPNRMTAANIPRSCRFIDTKSTCISQDWIDIGSQLVSFFPAVDETRATTPENYRLSDLQSVRDANTRTTARTSYAFNAAFTTIPMSALANALSKNGQLWVAAAANFRGCTKRFRRFMWRKNAVYSIKDAKQPATAVVCYNFTRTYLLRKDISRQIDDGMMLFPTGKSVCEDINTRNHTNHSLTEWQQLQPEPLQFMKNFLNVSSKFSELQFIELPRTKFGRISIGALASVYPYSTLYSCAIRSRWADTVLKSTRNNLKVVSGEISGGWLEAEMNACGHNDSAIDITSEWASYLNPVVRSTNKTVYQSLIEFAGKPPSTSTWSRSPLYFGSVTESILSGIITAGLSLTQSNAKVQGTLKFDNSSTCAVKSCKSWCVDMMPNDKMEFGYGQNIYNMSSFNVANTTKFTMQVDVEGYAYNIKGNSMILSCVVLLAYCIMVAIHLGFVLWTRSSSTSWDSVSEVVALAMQSKPSDKLGNTCAGINSTGVFTNNVRIIRTGPQRDHLELDFDDGTTLSNAEDRITEKDFFG